MKLPTHLRQLLIDLHDFAKHEVYQLHFGFNEAPITYPFWINPSWQTLILTLNTQIDGDLEILSNHAINISAFRAIVAEHLPGKSTGMRIRGSKVVAPIYLLDDLMALVDFPLNKVNLVSFDITEEDIARPPFLKQGLYPEIVVVRHKLGWSMRDDNLSDHLDKQLVDYNRQDSEMWTVFVHKTFNSH